MPASVLIESIDVKLPPTQDELPCDDGEPMETASHRQQMILLIETLQPWLDQRPDGYAGGNMFLYFSLAQVRHQDFRGPDFYAVLGVPKGERKSWVVWEEGKGPDVIIELLSESTATTDKTEKKLIYQNQLKVAEYYWFDPFNPDDWAGFELRRGTYEPLPLDGQGRLTSQCLGLALVRWQGIYEGVEATWLRWATLAGELLPTKDEKLNAAQQHAAAAERHAVAAQQHAAAAEQRTDAAEKRMEAVLRRAEVEAQRAAAAEQEIARLRALLADKNQA
jgi:Uma2 family endonuclease